MNWYIGQKVVYVGTDPDYPKGVRTIKSLDSCSCGISIDTGIELPNKYPFAFCEDCKKVFNGDKFWKFETLFRPLEDNFIEQIEKESIVGGKELEVLIETYQKETV